MFRKISGLAQVNPGKKWGKTQKSTNNHMTRFGLIEKESDSQIYPAVFIDLLCFYYLIKFLKILQRLNECVYHY